MKAPTSYNGKFNSIYSELRDSLPLNYSEFEILKTTKALLDAHIEENRRDSLIVKNEDNYPELDFSEPYYTDRDFPILDNELSILENHSIDGVFVPSNYILKAIHSPNHSSGL